MSGYSFYGQGRPSPVKFVIFKTSVHKLGFLKKKEKKFGDDQCILSS